MNAPAPYNYHWRTVIVPRTRRLHGGRFETLRTRTGEVHDAYRGLAKCVRCGHIDCMPLRQTKAGMRHVSELDCAHLVKKPGEEGHGAPENLAMLCRKCHRGRKQRGKPGNDYDAWAIGEYERRLARKQERIDKADAARPILQAIREVETCAVN